MTQKYDDKTNDKRIGYFFGNELDRDKMIMERMEGYSEFLKDGDFEKWQPMTELKLFSESKEETIKYIESRLEACRIFMRAIWIMNRFTDYLSPEWGIYAWFENSTYNMIKVYTRMLENLNRKPHPEIIEEF